VQISNGMVNPDATGDSFMPNTPSAIT